METTDEGWVTDQRVIDVAFALEGMQPGDRIRIVRARNSSLSDVPSGTHGVVSKLGFFSADWSEERMLHFDFLPGHRLYRGMGNYWIRRCSISAWQPRSGK